MSTIDLSRFDSARDLMVYITDHYRGSSISINYDGSVFNYEIPADAPDDFLIEENDFWAWTDRTSDEIPIWLGNHNQRAFVSVLRTLYNRPRATHGLSIRELRYRADDDGMCVTNSLYKYSENKHTQRNYKRHNDKVDEISKKFKDGVEFDQLKVIAEELKINWSLYTFIDLSNPYKIVINKNYPTHKLILSEGHVEKLQTIKTEFVTNFQPIEYYDFVEGSNIPIAGYKNGIVHKIKEDNPFNEFIERNEFVGILPSEPDYDFISKARNTCNAYYEIPKDEFMEKITNVYEIDQYKAYGRYNQGLDDWFIGIGTHPQPLLKVSDVVGEGVYVIEPINLEPLHGPFTICTPLNELLSVGILTSTQIRYVRSIGIKVSIIAGMWSPKCIRDVFTENELTQKKKVKNAEVPYYSILTGCMLRTKKTRNLSCYGRSDEWAERIRYIYQNRDDITVNVGKSIMTVSIRQEIPTYAFQAIQIISCMVLKNIIQILAIGKRPLAIKTDALLYDFEPDHLEFFRPKSYKPPKDGRIKSAKVYCRAKLELPQDLKTNEITTNSNLIVLTGQCGSGKTSLAVKHSRRALLLTTSNEAAKNENDKNRPSVKAVSYQAVVKTLSTGGMLLKLDQMSYQGSSIKKWLEQITDVIVDEAGLYPAEEIRSIINYFSDVRIFLIYGDGQTEYWNSDKYDFTKGHISGHRPGTIYESKSIINLPKSYRIKDQSLVDLYRSIHLLAVECKCSGPRQCENNKVIKELLLNHFGRTKKEELISLPGRYIVRTHRYGNIINSTNGVEHDQLQNNNIFSVEAIQGDDDTQSAYKICITGMSCKHLYSSIGRTGHSSKVKLFDINIFQ